MFYVVFLFLQILNPISLLMIGEGESVVLCCVSVFANIKPYFIINDWRGGRVLFYVVFGLKQLTTILTCSIRKRWRQIFIPTFLKVE